MKKSKLLSDIAPVLVLFILSPVIAELLFGSTPVSRASQLIPESLFYGSGALLIREFVRRRNLGWFSVIVMGIAFGIIEECITLQSVFNPNFMGNDLTYGRLWGVNWVWGMCIIGYHAIWSITIPIFFTELLFPSRKKQSWLNITGIIIFTILFILSAVAFYTFFQKTFGFSASPIQVLVAAVIAAGLIFISTRIPVFPILKNNLKAPPAFVAGIISFVASALWFGILYLVFNTYLNISPWLAVLAGLLLILTVLFWVSSRTIENRTESHLFFLATGSLYASMLFGLNTLWSAKNMIDIISQLCFIILVTVFLVLIRKRLLSKEVQ